MTSLKKQTLRDHHRRFLVTNPCLDGMALQKRAAGDSNNHNLLAIGRFHESGSKTMYGSMLLKCEGRLDSFMSRSCSKTSAKDISSFAERMRNRINAAKMTMHYAGGSGP
jgi:hypothetical protein